MFEISQDLTLNPVRRGRRYYIEYWYSSYAPAKARWLRFCAKRCAGKDAYGRYYRSRKHAETVIHEFCASEDAREKTP
jgi:hypothetical protein